MKKIHLTPRSNFEKATNLTVLPENKSHVYAKLRSLNNHLKSSELFEPNERVPADRKQLTFYHTVSFEKLFKSCTLCTSSRRFEGVYPLCLENKCKLQIPI